MATWELRSFFPQRPDGDMQKQLGLTRQVDQDRTLAAVALVAVGGVTSATQS